MGTGTGELMAGVSGVRGIVGRGLTPDVATAYATAYAAACGPGPILLARDPRGSGFMLRSAVLAALLASGRDVIDLSMVPTPTLLLSTRLLEAAGGIMITASHNPIEWNGLKFADPRGRYLAPERSAELIEAVAAGRRQWATAEQLGRLSFDFATPGEQHVRSVLAAPGVQPDAIRQAGLRVALDACNGAGTLIFQHFLSELGVRIHPLHVTLDGRFPRPPEPTPEALAPLGELVRTTRAHLGLALDPDADRLALVGPDGRPWGEECTLALAAYQVLSVDPGPVAANLSTSRMLDDVASAFGVEVIRTPVGEINVVEGMLTAGAVIGGEGNGGVIHPAVVLGRDALTGTALVLSLLAAAGGDAEAMRALIPAYVMIKRRYALPEGGADALRERLSELAADQGSVRVDQRDGVRLDWDDSWVHVRPSNTEPVVRLIAEARQEHRAAALVEQTAARLRLKGMV